MDDALFREMLIWCLGLGASAFVLGGLLTRVSGVFEEEGRRITLRQLGPWVWGHCAFEGGKQNYTGFAVFGRVRLARRDFGLAHLITLGFSQDNAETIEGQSTGLFRFRLVASGLSGVFRGYRFRQEGAQMRMHGLGPAQARSWRRLSELA